MAKKTIDEIDVQGRRVLMRVDFNVPLADGEITDDRRIEQALGSIRSVIDRGGKLILMSHLGRPAGTGPEAEFSLQPVARRLGKLLGRSVGFCGACVGAEAEAAVKAVAPGSVLLLENLRFHAAETMIDKAKKNPDKRPTAEQRRQIDDFARGLAAHADVYCNDAFGTCHRLHASMYDVPLLAGAGRRVCGRLVQKELRFLGDALTEPKRPFIAILGGAKVSDKIGVIESLLKKANAILIGGAMSYTFLAAKGERIGASLCERDKLGVAKRLMQAAGDRLLLPSDSVCAAKLEKNAATRVLVGGIDDGLAGFDIGPRTIERYGEAIRGAGCVVWNGPMGVFETPPFDAGTLAVGRFLADATPRGAITIIGGGDSAAAVEAAGLAEQMTHISTGGGASLEFLEGRTFASIDLLDDAEAAP